MLKEIRQHIPNFITLLNLFSGCIAIVISFTNIQIAALFIIIAAVFDYADGLSARLLKAYSDIGKSLDSLADIVSFGVAPSIIVYQLLTQTFLQETHYFTLDTASPGELRTLFSAFLIAVFSAIRLSLFSVDYRQSYEFMGLPTPASGIFIASLGYYSAVAENDLVLSIIFSVPVLITIVVILSALMVSPLPMFSLKFKNFSFAENRIRYIFSAISAVLLLLWNIPALTLVIFSYIMLSGLSKWISPGEK